MKKVAAVAVPTAVHIICCGGVLLLLASSGLLVVLAETAGDIRVFLLLAISAVGLFWLYLRQRQRCKLPGAGAGSRFGSQVLLAVAITVAVVVTVIYVVIPLWLPGYSEQSPGLLPG